MTAPAETPLAKARREFLAAQAELRASTVSHDEDRYTRAELEYARAYKALQRAKEEAGL